MDFKTENFEGYQYLIKFPNGYKTGEKYPVILFLHGAGGRGEDINLVKDNPYFKLTAEYEDFPFITVAPQCTENTWFDMFERLKKFADMIFHEDYTDKERFYLMGVSMGGYGAWQLAMSKPEIFAAVIPICGGGMSWNAARLVNVPVWAFHGVLDHLVSYNESVNLVNAVNANGGNAKLTSYPERKHDAWTPTYKNPEVFEWLLSNINKNTKEFTNEFNDSRIYG